MNPTPLLKGRELMVDSSAANRVVFDAPTGRLFVEFKNDSGHRFYCYKDVSQDFFNELRAATSVGSLLSSLRYRYRSDRVSAIPDGPVQQVRHLPEINDKQIRGDNGNRFPRATKRTENNTPTPDFTAQWLDLIKQLVSESATDSRIILHIQYLQTTLESLSSKKRIRPPSFPPPPLPDTRARVPVDRSEDGPEALCSFSSSNMFAALNLNDSDEEELDEDRSSPKVLVSPALTINGEISMQVRYLMIYLTCAEGELVRMQALSKRRDPMTETISNHYAVICQFWIRAFATLNEMMINNDACWAVYYQRDCEIESGAANAEDPLPDKHNFGQLAKLLDRISIVRDDTEKSRDMALHRLERRLQFVDAKLNPMIRERDEVKSRVGVRRWKNNPSPKLTYAEQRAEWEEEKKAIESALDVIAGLSLWELKV